MKSLLPRTAPALALCLLLIVSLADAPLADKWRGTETEVEGVKHVMNPAEPMESPQTVELKELWRIGGDTEDEDEFFGFIQTLTCDGEGNVYLLDNQLHEVKVFSPDGEHLRTMGREGEGPGEFRRPAGLFISPANTVVVQQPGPPRLVQFDMNGDPMDDLPLPTPPDGGFRVYAAGRNAGDHLLMIIMQFKPTEGQREDITELASVSVDGEIMKILHTETRILKFADIVVDERTSDGFINRWVSDPEGRVALAPEHQAYKIKVCAPDGSIEHIIEREYKSLKRDAEAFQTMTDVYTSAVARNAPGVEADIRINDLHKDIMSLYMRDNGEIWALSSRGRYEKPEGTLGVFDVFDRQGRFVRQVTLKGEGDPENDFYFFFGDRLFVATDLIGAAVASQGLGGLGMGDDAEPMSIICYDLNP